MYCVCIRIYIHFGHAEYKHAVSFFNSYNRGTDTRTWGSGDGIKVNVTYTQKEKKVSYLHMYLTQRTCTAIQASPANLKRRHTTTSWTSWSWPNNKEKKKITELTRVDKSIKCAEHEYKSTSSESYSEAKI